MPVEFDHTIDISSLRSRQRLDDALARRSVARLLADRLLAQPGVVGVYGSWGSGKSFVLDLTIELLFTAKTQVQYRPVVCYFQPWRFEPDTSLAPGLVKALGEVPQQFPSLNPMLQEERPGWLHDATNGLLGLMRRVVGVLGPVAHVGAAAAAQLPAGVLPPALEAVKPGLAALDVAAAMNVENKQGERIADWDPDGIKDRMQQLIQGLQKSAARGEGDLRSADEYRVVVVIDDLDRCAPDLMVDMLNWLKVHLSVPGCSYLMALDHGAAAKAIVGKYGAYLGEGADIAYGLRYLEKIVDFEVELGESGLVERMAAQAVSKADSVIEIVERLIHRQGVRSAEIRGLMRLQTLQSPRTMLKVVSRFSALLGEIQQDQEARNKTSSDRRQLPTDYAFWLLLLVAMYYRLSPWQIEAFCHGQGPLMSADGKELESADVSMDPLIEFKGFLGSVLRDSRGEHVQPSPTVLMELYTTVRQLVVS